MTIWARGAYTPVWEHGPNNYLYLHDQYLHPNFVLKHDHITLQGCTPTHAIFAVVDPDVNVYDLNKHPFVMVAQYYNAQKLVFIPLWACVKLGEEMGDPDPDMNIISISNSARSGSTLLAKMFHNLPDALAMNEPWALYHLHRWYNSSKIRERDYPKFVQALCRLQFKPFQKVHNLILYNIGNCFHVLFILFFSEKCQINSFQRSRPNDPNAFSHCQFFPWLEDYFQQSSPNEDHDFLYSHSAGPRDGTHVAVPIP